MPVSTSLRPDVLDPGADGSYPHFPRDHDGAPLWSTTAATDGTGVTFQTSAGPVTVAAIPRGLRSMKLPGAYPPTTILIDLTPYDRDGQPVNPPVIPGWTPGYGNQ